MASDLLFYTHRRGPLSFGDLPGSRASSSSCMFSLVCSVSRDTRVTEVDLFAAEAGCSLQVCLLEFAFRFLTANDVDLRRNAARNCPCLLFRSEMERLWSCFFFFL